MAQDDLEFGVLVRLDELWQSADGACSPRQFEQPKALMAHNLEQPGPKCRCHAQGPNLLRSDPKGFLHRVLHIFRSRTKLPCKTGHGRVIPKQQLFDRLWITTSRSVEQL